MVLVNFVTIVVLNVLDNLHSMQNSLIQITADIRETSKTVKPDLFFIINVFSEFRIHFSYILIVLA